MDVRHTLIDAVRTALTDLGVDPVPDVVQLERPANPDHGDWSTNVALVSAKVAGRNPRELGTALADHLSTAPPAHVVGVEVAGPGFVNFRLADSWLHEVLVDVVVAGTAGWGRNNHGAGAKVIVEFVSANPTGPLHAGHGRGACYGDSVARLYERCGYQVAREFYINDRGIQMQSFAASLAARAAGREVADDGYHGQYIVDWAAEMPADADPLEWGYARALTAIATADRSFDMTPLVERAEHWHDARATMAIILRLDSAAAKHEAEAIALAREVADFEYARHQRIAASIAELRKERERQRLLDEEDARRARAMTTSGPTTTIEATPPIEEGPSDIQWEALRYCEATGNYSAVSPTGKYRGAYQFSVETWDWIAGLYYEHLIGLDPAEARAFDQDRMARVLYDLRGRGQWPVCGRYLP